jgi:hypothetical protein
MGLLAVDVTSFGVVMSADSQAVTILDGRNEISVQHGGRSRNPMVIRCGGGFVGLVGFAGTEEIEGKLTAEWLRNFSAAWPQESVGTFCERLSDTLTGVWRQTDLSSVLEILVTGEVQGDVQFWYVRNSQGLREDGKHAAPADSFHVENDLDVNYIPHDQQVGETKEDVLRTRMYSFRQGVLLPASPVFDAFTSLMTQIYAGRVEGFSPLGSLDDVGQFARVRMEFLKRLCTAKYGIYEVGTPTPVGGVVHVFGVARTGEIRKYVKGRNDVQTVRPGRG